MIRKLIQTDASKSTLLIRLMVGAVFLSEGLQKFLFPAQRGTGRFEKMGFPEFETMAHLVGAFEIVAGLLILAGLLTRGGALLTFIIMTVAIIVTKIPIALGHGFGPFTVRELSDYGFWPMAHAMRTDFAMWLGSLFLLFKGGGRWSADHALYRHFYSFRWSDDERP